ncbi:MAG: YitT family protein [Clostridiales bacterium]|nr:YitT family protein [Clostridiales bacterium]
MKKKTTARLLSLLAVVAGNFLYALSVRVFLLPTGLVTGGTTGLAMVINHLCGLPVSAFVLAFNMAMLLLGWWLLGRAFALTTLASSFLYPAFLEVIGWFMGDFVLTEDLLLNTIFFGLGIGISLGIVIRAGASTGGMDIPMLVLQKYLRIPVSVSMYVFDCLILLLQLFFSNVDSVLYGVVLAIIYTVMLDKMLMLGTSRTEVRIVSDRAREISAAILSQVDRGVTLLHGEGGYLHEQTEIVMSVISNRELIKLERLVHEIDPECFMIVNRVSEVHGRGFTIDRNKD